MKRVLFVFLGCMLFVSCDNQEYVKRLQELDEGVGKPTSIEELQAGIAQYKRRVEDMIVAQDRIGVWYKMLGTRYMENQMYGLALEAFQSAIEYYPENKNLFFYVGVCASHLAKASLDYPENAQRNKKEMYFNLACQAFEHAIELDSNYHSAKLSLAVLYVFDLDNPEKAIPLLEPIVASNAKPFSELFVLARAYYMTGNNVRAVELYDRIINTSKNKTQIDEAKKNKAIVLEMTGMN